MSFTVSGVDGWLHLIAALLFLVAAIMAWVGYGRAEGHFAGGGRWASFVALGLFLWVLSLLVS
jgi:hypothetical protein